MAVVDKKLDLMLLRDCKAQVLHGQNPRNERVQDATWRILSN